jgi:hypothetical protein
LPTAVKVAVYGLFTTASKLLVVTMVSPLGVGVGFGIGVGVGVGVGADKSENFGFLTEAFNGRLNGINDEIKVLIKQGDGFEKQIAVKMDAMLSLFMAETSGMVKDPKEAKKTALEDFYKYSEAEFGFKKTRAMDYQSVGCREDVMALNLPFSQLVEIARIDGDALQTLLKMFPESELNKCS